MVGRLGLEPRTNGLRGHCSTIELTTQLYEAIIPSKLMHFYSSSEVLAESRSSRQVYPELASGSNNIVP